jgi:hypothetical protein
MLAHHLSKFRFIENMHAELLRFLELAAWLRACEHVIRLFAYAAACKGRVNSTVCVIPYERELKACITTNSRATDAIL